ncbi:hypothetical protein M0638_27905 [Roseomonas sp. NAR14]|uniref:Lipoprotein n=1 Tax=Roseomonas acroporae TaxID=2937791 RepID=A0A9X1YDJ2_9PROT|nr:hypothetical protein [Roseomonas acroporae]MCK8788178.1 hypothetical protein [Roseomonas acroporae]
MKPLVIAAVASMTLAGCAPQPPERQFQASTRSAVELRAMQSRMIDGEANTVLRGVIATLHDLGYRIDKAEPNAGTVTATKMNTVRLTAVVRQREPGRSVVRANAVVWQPRLETQVDEPNFYLANFFAPLAATLGREAFAAPEDGVPEAVRPAPDTSFRRPATPTAQEPAR